jgi:hypothetical protein
MRNNSLTAKRWLRSIISCAAALLFLFGTLAVAPQVADAQSQQRRRNRFEYTIRNNSSFEITRLYFNSSETDDWGPDRLGANVLPAGQAFRLTNIVAGEYDMKVVDEDGDECVLYNITVCGNGAYSFTNDNLLRCEGYRP